MKKLTSLLCLCAFAFAQIGTAMADDSGSTEASNYLKLSGAVSESEYVLTVSLQNTDKVRDMMFDIAVPTGLTVSDMAIADFSSASTYTLATNEAKSRVILYSTVGTTFVENYGSPVLNITLGKEDGMTFEGQMITLSGVQLTASTDNVASLVQTEDNASYTIPVSYADVSGTVYAGTSEAQTMTLEAFALLQETAPNAIMIVDGTNVDLVGDVKNVVYEYANDGVKSYICRDFVLTDRYGFYTPYDFYAKSAKYTRTVGSSIYTSTLCLPFALSTGDLPSTSNYKILTFAYYKVNPENEGYDYVYFNSNSSIKAGVPCFLYSANPTDWDINVTDVMVVSTPENSGGLKGAFVETPINTYTNCYQPSTSNTTLAPATSNLMPLRCVLSLDYDTPYNNSDDSSAESTQAPQRLKMMIIDDETNGIETINMDEDETVIYNINGQKVLNADKAGFYIINGKKVIKK